jgi:hypothetical protein
MVIATKFASG